MCTCYILRAPLALFNSLLTAYGPDGPTHSPSGLLAAVVVLMGTYRGSGLLKGSTKSSLFRLRTVSDCGGAYGYIYLVYSKVPQTPFCWRLNYLGLAIVQMLYNGQYNQRVPSI